MRKLINRIRNVWNPPVDNEELIKRIGAFAVYEYLNSRNARRRFKGTKLELLIKEAINESKR